MANPFANFATPTTVGNSTPVHKFPLPPEGRQFRPTYVRGKYSLPSPEPENGKVKDTFTRVTTGAHALDETTGLDKWKMRNVVLGIHQQPNLLDKIDLFAEPYEVTRTLNDVASKASDAAGASEAAERGTAIHAWTEAVERDGMDVADVPREFKPFVTSYLEALERAGVETVPGLVERIVWHKGTGWVGTFDRVYRLADGTQVIGDVKTSKDLKYGYLGFSMQLAVYADADAMLKVDGSGWEAMPAVGNVYGVIAHLPSNNPGHCELVTLDLERGRYAIELAERVRHARATAGVNIPNVHPLPEVDLATLVDKATSAGDLANLYERFSTRWTPELTERGMLRIESLNSANTR